RQDLRGPGVGEVHDARCVDGRSFQEGDGRFGLQLAVEQVRAGPDARIEVGPRGRIDARRPIVAKLYAQIADDPRQGRLDIFALRLVGLVDDVEEAVVVDAAEEVEHAWVVDERLRAVGAGTVELDANVPRQGSAQADALVEVLGPGLRGRGAAGPLAAQELAAV